MPLRKAQPGTSARPRSTSSLLARLGRADDRGRGGPAVARMPGGGSGGTWSGLRAAGVLGRREPVRHDQHDGALGLRECTREVGMLPTIGMTRRQARRMIRHESIITALIGAAPSSDSALFLAALMTQAAPGWAALTIPWQFFAAFTLVAVLAVLAVLASSPASPRRCCRPAARRGSTCSMPCSTSNRPTNDPVRHAATRPRGAFRVPNENPPTDRPTTWGSATPSA